MSVSGADFHSFASRIFATATEEIEFRNVISRVYYAAFHACLPHFAVTSGEVSPRMGHADFSRWLMDQPAGTPLRALGFALDFLRQHRNGADYSLDRPFVRADAVTAFGAYDNVMRLLQRASEPAAPP